MMVEWSLNAVLMNEEILFCRNLDFYSQGIDKIFTLYQMGDDIYFCAG